VVVAAGSGRRFGAPKQFAFLGGRPVVEWSVSASRSVADGVVLVLPAGATEHHGADVVVPGGPTRSASVRQGLAAVPADIAVVVVHDGGRPLADPGLFSAVVGAVRDGAAGAVCALPVAETIKRVAGDPPVVAATVPRVDLVTVQTPQAFDAVLLRRAHADAPEATDDAALVEALGATVRVVPGDPRNIKLTTPADLAYAEHLLTGAPPR
jgi:2-C-methyl-D-erythritol 4-phosphate cytidylyltransferase